MSFPNAKISRGKHATNTKQWRNVERHYCSCCNVWMGSDRQSIRLHENGKKHKENVEFQLAQRRQTVLREEKEMKQVQSALQQMEQAAAAKMGMACSTSVYEPSFTSTSSTSTTATPTTTTMPTTLSTTHPTYPPDSRKLMPAKNPTLAQHNSHKPVKTGVNRKEELNVWHERKMKREKDRTIQSEEEEAVTNELPQTTTSYNAALSSTTTQRHLSKGEGHYTVGAKTYLEGKFVFGHDPSSFT